MVLNAALTVLICISVTAVVAVPSLPSVAAGSSESSFDERLLIRPMPDGSVMTHFQFQIDSLRPISDSGSGNGGSISIDSSHFTLFPKPLAQIANRFGVEVPHPITPRLGSA